MIKKYWKPVVLVMIIVALIYLNYRADARKDWELSKAQQELQKEQKKIEELEGKYKEIAKLNTELTNDKNQITKENKILAEKLRNEIAKPAKIKYITVDKKKYVLKTLYDELFDLAIKTQDQFDEYRKKSEAQVDVYEKQITILKEKENLYQNQIRILNRMNYKLYRATKRKVFIGVGATYGMRTDGGLGGVIGLTLVYKII